MPSIKSLAFCEGVTETVVPGQTRTSPPLDKSSTAVSLPAVRDDPAAKRFPAKTTSPTPPVTGTAGAAGANERTCGGWEEDVLLAALRSLLGSLLGLLSASAFLFGSAGGFSRTIRWVFLILLGPDGQNVFLHHRYPLAIESPPRVR